MNKVHIHIYSNQLNFILLVNLKDPPVKIVRKFLHLLDQSDLDFEEELGTSVNNKNETLLTCTLKVPMKRIFLFDIFVDKGLKFRFLLLKLNIAPFNNSRISVKHDKSHATNSTQSEICT